MDKERPFCDNPECPHHLVKVTQGIESIQMPIGTFSRRMVTRHVYPYGSDIMVLCSICHNAVQMLRTQLRGGSVKQIHPSHDMTEWEETIVTLNSTSRFGQLRKCKKCEAEQAKTVAGEGTHDELYEPCRG